MDQKLVCRACREIFPLAAVESATDTELEQMEKHLAGCTECREAWADERPLLIAACLTATGSDDHPEIDLLRRYVMESHTVSSAETDGIREHLKVCAICRESVTGLQQLPADATELLNEETAPFLTSLDAASAPDTPISQRSPARRMLWNPLTAYAAAAVLLLTAVGLWFRSPAPPPAALISVSIPSSVRTAAGPITIPTPTVTSYLEIRFPVLPEADHEYGLHLIDAASQDTLYSRRPLLLDSSTGIAAFTVLADTGRYAVVFEDIIGGDTLSLTKPIHLVLQPSPPVAR